VPGRRARKERQWARKERQERPPVQDLLESAMLMADASLQAALRSAVVAVKDSRLMAIPGPQ